MLRSCGGATGSSVASPAQQSRTGTFAVSKPRFQHVSTESLKIPFFKWPFYYVALESKRPFFYTIRKMKLEAMGLDPDPVGLVVDHVSVQLSGSITFQVGFWAMVERNLDFDLVIRTTVRLRDWEARWPFRNVYYFFFSIWMPPEIGIGRVLHVVEFLVNFRMRCWCSTVSALA